LLEEVQGRLSTTKNDRQQKAEELQAKMTWTPWRLRDFEEYWIGRSKRPNRIERTKK